MFKLFQSLFGSETKGSYPESLVKAAIERAVEGTDPCLRAVSGYKKNCAHLCCAPSTMWSH